jgi:hypothetical protein
MTDNTRRVMMKEFPKTVLLKIKWTGIIVIKPMYVRMANASTLYIPLFKITWRRSWLPQAAYEQGWDAAFRQCNRRTKYVEYFGRS